VSFAAITLSVASQRVFIGGGGVYFVIDSVRKLLDTPFHSYKPRLQKDRKCRLAQYLPVL